MTDQPVKPAVGSLYIADTGDAYRLRGYGSDFENPDNPDPEAVPDYAILRVEGGMGVAHELPASAVLAWAPSTVVTPIGARKVPPRTADAAARNRRSQP